MWKWLIGALLAVAVVASLLWQRQGPALSLDTATVTRSSIDVRLQLTGTVINDRTVTLTALLDGEIMAIKAREGDDVKAGTVLAELDSRQARALLDKASAELVLQQQSVDATTRNYERISRLSRAGNASEQSLDDSLNAKLTAEASLKAASATLTLNQLRLDNAQIKAPFDGTVIAQSAETGQWLEAGQPLFKLVATEGTVIEAAVSTSDWPRLSVGLPVEISSESDPALAWNSAVSWIAPTVTEDQSQGNRVAVRISPGEASQPLLLGQELDVDLLLEQAENVLALPLAMLQEQESGQYAAFVIEDGVARERAVTLGLTSLDDAEIVEGLVEGERVIVLNGQRLVDGQSVEAR